jgi:hypothetical protein
MADRVPIGFERWEPGHPWGDVVFSDRTRRPVADPDGAIENEVRGIATTFQQRGGAPPAPTPVPAPTPALTGAPSAVEPTLPPEPYQPPPAAPASPMLPAPTPGQPTTSGSPAAAVAAQFGLQPNSRQPAAAAAPAATAPAARQTPAEQVIRNVAPNLMPAAANVTVRGPDPVGAERVRGTSDAALLLRGESIRQAEEGSRENLESAMLAAQQGYARGVNQYFTAKGQEAAEQQAKDIVAGKKAQLAATPLDPKRYVHRSTWATALAIIGGAAGIVAEATSSLSRNPQKYKSTFVRDLLALMDQDLQLQRTERSEQINELEKQLGSREAAINYARSQALGGLAGAVDERQRFARSKEAYNLLGSASNELRAHALDAANRTDAQLLGDASASVQLAQPKPVAGGGRGTLNPETAEEQAVLKQNGVDDKTYAAYGKARLETGADATIGSADNALSVIDKVTAGQDVPGVGPIDKLMQPYMRGEDAAAVQQVVGMVNSQFVKAISGAAATDTERAHLQKVIEGRGTLADVKRGMAMVKDIAGRQLEVVNNTQPGAARAYDSILGLRRGRTQLTDEQRKRKGLQAKGGGQKVVAKEGDKEFYESPEAKRKREAREAREGRQQTSGNNDRDRVKGALFGGDE